MKTAGKRPAVIATTSLSLLAASVLGMPTTTSATDQSPYIENPSVYIRHLSDGLDSSTSTNMAMSYEKTQELASAKFAADEMFGEMRGSTPEEADLYESMLARISKPIDANIFSL